MRLGQLSTNLETKTAAQCGPPLVELLGFWMVNETDDAHLPLALGADEDHSNGPVAPLYWGYGL